MDAEIKNNHDRTLNVGGVDIRPGKSAVVKNWQKFDRNPAHKAWLQAGLIEIVGVNDTADRLPGLPGTATSTPNGLPGLPGAESEEDKAKRAAIEELATFGVERTMKSSLESLQKQVEEQRAKAKG